MRAGIAFGSNLADRVQMLRAARACVMASTHVVPPALASHIYATSPVGCPPGSGTFLNAVLEVGLNGAPLELLRDLRACETALGRSRPGDRNAPRRIDLDLLYAGDREIDTEELRLPHPRMAERRFVLAPLAEIRPGLVLPGKTKTVAELLENLPPGDDAVEALELEW